MKIFFILLMASLSVQADEPEGCLDEAVETAVSVKIMGAAKGACSSLDKDSYLAFEEDRQNKKKFLKNAKAALAKGESIPASIFEDLNEAGSGKMLDKSNICSFLKEKNLKAIKKSVMQDCPEKGAAELYQWGLNKSELRNYSLAHVCNKVEEMKTQACQDSKVVFESASDKKDTIPPAMITPSSGGGAASSRASHQ